MAIVAGSTVLLKIYDGVSAYGTIGAGTATSVTHNNQPITTKNKDSVWNTILDLPGQKDVAIEFSGYFPENGDDAAYENLKAVVDSTTDIVEQFEFVLGDGEKLSGSFAVSNHSLSGPDSEAATYSITLASTGAITRASA